MAIVVWLLQWSQARWIGKDYVQKIITEDLVISIKFVEHSAILDRAGYHRTGTASLITWYCFVSLFSFPQAQGDDQGNPFWKRVGHQVSSKDEAERHPRRIPRAVHKSITEKDRELHSTQEGLFEGETICLVVLNKNKLFVTPVPLLFGHTLHSEYI